MRGVRRSREEAESGAEHKRSEERASATRRARTGCLPCGIIVHGASHEEHRVPGCNAVAHNQRTSVRTGAHRAPSAYAARITFGSAGSSCVENLRRAAAPCGTRQVRHCPCAVLRRALPYD